MKRSLMMLLVMWCLTNTVPGWATELTQVAPLVKIAADDWCPQHCERARSHSGYIIEIVETAFSSQNQAYQIHYLPWLRAKKETLSGQYDMLLTPTREEFPEFYFSSEPVGEQEYCLYVSNDSQWRYEVPSDLKGKVLGYLEGSGLGELQHFINAHPTEVKSVLFYGSQDYTQRLFDFLARERTDVVIITSDVYRFQRQQNLIADEFHEAGCLGKKSLLPGFSPKNAERSNNIGQILDKGIRQIRQSGQLAEILSRYGLRDWQD